MRIGRQVILLATVAACAGCPSIARRPLLDPGPAEFQRKSDAYWDPYPKLDFDPQGLEDTRPRDFARPVSEVKQAQATPFIRNGVSPRFPSAPVDQ